MGRYIDGALGCVGAQSYRNWEIIAVDDCGPEDGTLASVQRFAAQFADRNVKYIRHDVNKGAGAAGAARNTGIRAANGDILAFLDPDDLWGGNYLQAHVDVFAEHADVAVSYATARIISERGELTGEIWGVTDAEIASLPFSLYVRNFITSSAIACRREAAEQVGGFDPGILHADWDFVLRLLAQDYRFQHAPEALLFYRKHSAGASSEWRKMQSGDVAVRRKHLENQDYRNYMAVYISELEARIAMLQADVARLRAPWVVKLRRRVAGRAPHWARDGWRRIRSLGT
jgi:GT2 family glycosyltransferase